MDRDYDIHVGDEGTELRFWLTDAGAVVDLQLATTMNLFLKSPVDPWTVSTYAMAFVTDGTDGGLKYVLTTGNVNIDGAWSAQVHVITPSGSWKSTVVTINVARNLA